MKVLVTGGCGFIGQHVVRQLVRRGDCVHVLDAKTPVATGWNTVADLIGRANLFLGDVASHQTVRAVFGRHDYDACLHLAAQSHVDDSVRDPTGTIHTNVVGTQVIASACVENGVPLLYCSTDEVYGDAMDNGPDVFTEEDPLRPSSPYSAGKAAGELVVRSSGRTHGLRYVITRGTNAFGPGQYPQKLVPIACRLLQRGEPVPLHGGGEQIRQWIHVNDFARLVILAADGLVRGDSRVLGEAFNIAGPTLLSVRGLVQHFASVLGVTGPAFVDVPDRPGQDRAYRVDGSKSTEILGFTPEVSILDETQVRKLAEAYPATGGLDLCDYGKETAA
jgi:dTDP-glucose 4,6-dehydratase